VLAKKIAIRKKDRKDANYVFQFEGKSQVNVLRETNNTKRGEQTWKQTERE